MRFGKAGSSQLIRQRGGYAHTLCGTRARFDRLLGPWAVYRCRGGCEPWGEPVKVSLGAMRKPGVYCPTCRVRHDDDALFCGRCGRSLGFADGPVAARQPDAAGLQRG
jgi:hypothetical protein